MTGREEHADGRAAEKCADCVAIANGEFSAVDAAEHAARHRRQQAASPRDRQIEEPRRDR